MSNKDWIAVDHGYELRSNHLRGSLDLRRPNLGLHNLAFGGHESSGSIWGITITGVISQASNRTAAPGEFFLRGSDLIANYEGQESKPHEATIYWRSNQDNLGDDSLGQLLLQIGVSTDSLDSHPEVEIHTRLDSAQTTLLCIPFDWTSATETIEIHEHSEPVEYSKDDCAGVCVIFRPPTSDLSFIEMVHPSDFSRLSVNREDHETVSRWRLLGQFLEKGVIRQACMRGIWVERNNDISVALDGYREFASSEASLTV